VLVRQKFSPQPYTKGYLPKFKKTIYQGKVTTKWFILDTHPSFPYTPFFKNQIPMEGLDSQRREEAI